MVETPDSYSLPDYRISTKPHPGLLFARPGLARYQSGDDAALPLVSDELATAGQADFLADGRQPHTEEQLAAAWKDPRSVLAARRRREFEADVDGSPAPARAVRGPGGRSENQDAGDYRVPAGVWDDCSDSLGDWDLHKAQEKLRRWNSGSRLHLNAPAKGRVEFAFPQEDGGAGPDLARRAGAPDTQILKAMAMDGRGLPAKAKRQAYCGVLGARYECVSFEPGRKSGHRFFRRFGCKNRYCERCGPVIFKGLFAKYAGLRDVVAKLVPHCPCRGQQPDRVVAKLDFTSRNLGRMPTRDEVRSFNVAIRKFFRLVERRFDLRRDAYGALWCDEFGHNNSNLHAHAMYAGPWLPNRGEHKNELAELWRKATAGTVFAGSFIVSIKPAKSFEKGLAHALKYAGKFLSKDPGRLAELEKVFHRVKRVHTVAGFYNALPTEDSDHQAEGELSCPVCGAALARMPFPFGFVSVLEAQGYRDLAQVCRELGKERALSDARASPT